MKLSNEINEVPTLNPVVRADARGIVTAVIHSSQLACQAELARFMSRAT